MTNDDRLSELFAVERAEGRAPSAAEHGWQSLQKALDANAPALAVAHGPLKIGLSLATKAMVGSGLIAFAVTTGGLGIHAALREPVVAPPAVTVVARASVSPPASAVVPRSAVPEPPPELPSEASAVPARGSAAPVASSTFAEELRLMKAAKLQLDSGRDLLAKVLLDQHEQLYPQGVFRAERERLRARLPPAPRPSINFPDAPGAK